MSSMKRFKLFRSKTAVPKSIPEEKSFVNLGGRKLFAKETMKAYAKAYDSVPPTLSEASEGAPPSASPKPSSEPEIVDQRKWFKQVGYLDYNETFSQYDTDGDGRLGYDAAVSISSHHDINTNIEDERRNTFRDSGYSTCTGTAYFLDQRSCSFSSSTLSHSHTVVERTGVQDATASTVSLFTGSVAKAASSNNTALNSPSEPYYNPNPMDVNHDSLITDLGSVSTFDHSRDRYLHFMMRDSEDGDEEVDGDEDRSGDEDRGGE